MDYSYNTLKREQGHHLPAPPLLMAEGLQLGFGAIAMNGGVFPLLLVNIL